MESNNIKINLDIVSEKFREKFRNTLDSLLDGKDYHSLPKKEAKGLYNLAFDDTFSLFPEMKNEILVAYAWAASTVSRGQRAKSNNNGNNGHQLNNEKPQSYTDKYKNWVKDNDIIPSDKALAYFLGTSIQLYYGIRKDDLIPQGYEFEKLKDEQWKVTKRPYNKRQIEIKKLEDELKQMQQRLLNLLNDSEN